MRSGSHYCWPSSYMIRKMFHWIFQGSSGRMMQDFLYCFINLSLLTVDFLYILSCLFIWAHLGWVFNQCRKEASFCAFDEVPLCVDVLLLICLSLTPFQVHFTPKILLAWADSRINGVSLFWKQRLDWISVLSASETEAHRQFELWLYLLFIFFWAQWTSSNHLTKVLR